MIRSKKAQEEMVGFVLIIVLVAIILLVLLSFTLGKSQKDDVESYEVNSFIQSFLQYTSECRNQLEPLSVQKLVFSCEDSEICLDGRDSCAVLNSTLKEIIHASWDLNNASYIKGYQLVVLVDDEAMLVLEEGNLTNNYKGSVQDFSRRGADYQLFFKLSY